MTTVKHFTNVMQGAPQLANKWGCMVELLDACLVNGFNQKPVASITVPSMGTAIVTIAAGHLYKVDQVLLIEGANEAAFNGEVRVVSVASNKFTCTINAQAAGNASGTMTVKVAPLGFEKVFSGTSKGVYRSKNVLSNRPYLRVDDCRADAYNTGWAKRAKVGMAQGMVDIDTVDGAQAPYSASNPNQNWETTGEVNSGAVVDGWYKWYYTRHTGSSHSESTGAPEYNRPWVLVGDDRGFYLFNEHDNTQGNSGRGGYCFTDFESYRQGDPFNTLLAATDRYCRADATINGYGNDHANWFNRSMDMTGKILMRDHTLLGGNQRVGLTSLNTNNGQTISGRATGIPFPNPVDYSLILHPTFLMQESSKGLRGKLPGLMWVHNDQPLQDLNIVENVVGYAGRKFLLVRMCYENEQSTSVMAMDITGPWW